MQGVMEGDGHPEAGIYDADDLLPDHLHQPNAPVIPPSH